MLFAPWTEFLFPAKLLDMLNPNGIHNNVPILNVIALHLFPWHDVPVMNVEAKEHQKMRALHRIGWKKSRGG